MHVEDVCCAVSAGNAGTLRRLLQLDTPKVCLLLSMRHLSVRASNLCPLSSNSSLSAGITPVQLSMCLPLAAA